jgi:hypothetical protein
MALSRATIIDRAACSTSWTAVVETAPTAAASPRRGADDEAQPRAGERDAAPGQPVAQQLARPGQPAARRRLAPLEVVGGLLIGHLLEVAEHDRPAEPVGEPVDLLVDRRGGIVVTGAGGDRIPGTLGRAAFLVAATGGVRPELERDPPRHAMQPAADGALDPDRSGLARQQEEGGLEGVVGIVGVVEHAAADGQDHRPMPTDQRLEGQLIAVGHVTFQQPGVGLARQGPLAEEAADRPQGAVALHAGHDMLLPFGLRGSHYTR